MYMSKPTSSNSPKSTLGNVSKRYSQGTAMNLHSKAIWRPTVSQLLLSINSGMVPGSPHEQQNHSYHSGNSNGLEAPSQKSGERPDKFLHSCGEEEVSPT